ncbi:uncharacterized protein METZ01_LOCUS200646, partial [marine metagenome]
TKGSIVKRRQAPRNTKQCSLRLMGMI